MPEYPNGTQIITCFEKIIRFKKTSFDEKPSFRNNLHEKIAGTILSNATFFLRTLPGVPEYPFGVAKIIRFIILYTRYEISLKLV